MAVDVADASVLKHNVVHLLLKHPQGIKYGDFSGAFYKLHGHHPQLVLHGYSSLKYLLTSMKNIVVLEKKSQETVIKLAAGSSLNRWLDKAKGWDSFEEDFDSAEEGWDSYEAGWVSFEEEMDEEVGKDLSAASVSTPTWPLVNTFSAAKSVSTHGNPVNQCPPKHPIINKLVPLTERQKKQATDTFVLIREVVGVHPHGLKGKKLKQILKTKHGIDLAKFSIHRGYENILACLRDIPGLLLQKHKKVDSCVIQLQSDLSAASVSSTTRPLVRGLSADKSLLTHGGPLHQCPPKHPIINKLVPLTERQTKQATDAFALIRNVLQRNLCVLKLQRLRKILKAKHGFDLETFRITCGYKDTLSCLQEIPGLLVHRSEKVKNCVIQLQSDLSAASISTTIQPHVGVLSAVKSLPTHGDPVNQCPLKPPIINSRAPLAEGRTSQAPALSNTSPRTSLETDLFVNHFVPQKMGEKKCVLAAAIVPIIANLGDYPKGLYLEMLTEKLKKRGFDLERFSQDMGYDGTIDCLLEMPGLHLTFVNGRVPSNCVVQLCSCSPSLPALPVSAGSSLHKPLCSSASETKPGPDVQSIPLLHNVQPQVEATKMVERPKAAPGQGKKKEQKKCQNSQKEKKKSPAEVLALVTDHLKNYKSGLRVKKLQELLTLKGFDLEKFSITQGHKDSLAFLEQQMPELKIRYSENRLKCVVQQGPDVKSVPPLCNVQPQAEPPKMVEQLNAAPDCGGISKPFIRDFTSAGLDVSAPWQHRLYSSIPVPYSIIPKQPSSQEHHNTSSSKDKSTSQFSSDIPAQQSNVCQMGGQSTARESACPSDSQLLSRSSLTSQEHHDASSGKDESSSQPHTNIPAQQSNVCQMGGQSAARESSCPTDGHLLVRSSPTSPPHSEHLDGLKQQVACILARHPEGMSLFQFRAAYNTTYQHHLPLGNASSVKQCLLEMSDIVCMKGYGVQTVLLPVSPEKPPTKPGPPVFSQVENASLVLANPLPKAVVRPEPAVVYKCSLLKTPMEPQPCSIHPLTSDHLRAPDIKENCVLPKGQSPTASKMVAPLQESVRPKAPLGGNLDSSKGEEAAVKFCNSLPKATVTKPVVVSKSSIKPSISKTAAVAVPQLHPSVSSTSACLRAPGNKESPFFLESQLLKPPKPLVPVEKNVKAKAVPRENVLMLHSPVVFPAAPQVSRLNRNCTSDGLAYRQTSLANPSFSVNIPVPALFQPVFANLETMSQPVVYPPMHLPDTLANPPLSSASYQSVSRTQELVSVELAQPASQSRPVQPTSPSQRVEQADCIRTVDGLDLLQRASRTQDQGHSPAPVFSAAGHPVSLPSAKPPSLPPLESPSVKQPEKVHRKWLNRMPAAGDSVIVAPPARERSKPVAPSCQKQGDAVNSPATSAITPSSTASHQPPSSSFSFLAESDTLPSEPLIFMPHDLGANSAITTSSAKPPTLLSSPPGSPIDQTNQPSYASFRAGTGYDASCQSKPLPGMPREGNEQDSHHFTLPENQRCHLREEPMQPGALQNIPSPHSSNSCAIL